MGLRDRISDYGAKLLSSAFSSRAAQQTPLRAYGKLPVDREFLRVRCDDLPAARDYCTWLDQGFDELQRSGSRDGARLRRHWVLQTGDHGRTWLLGGIWDSADQPSEQGHQRAYPFTLFGVFRAPSRLHELASEVGGWADVWRQCEHHFQRLSAARDRSQFTDMARGLSLSLRPETNAAPGDRATGVGATTLTDWMAGVPGLDGTVEALTASLQRDLLDFRKSAGRVPVIWRLPVNVNMDIMGQLGIWMAWLDRNLGQCAIELALYVPADTTDGKAAVSVCFRRPRPEDLGCLALEADSEAASRKPRVGLTTNGDPPSGEIVALLAMSSAKDLTTLDDLSKLTLTPSPT